MLFRAVVDTDCLVNSTRSQIGLIPSSNDGSRAFRRYRNRDGEFVTVKRYLRRLIYMQTMMKTATQTLLITYEIGGAIWP